MAEQLQNTPVLQNLQSDVLTEITNTPADHNIASVNSSISFGNNPLRDEMLLNSSDNALPPENNNFGGLELEGSSSTASNNNDAIRKNSTDKVLNPKKSATNQQLRGFPKIELRSIVPETNKNTPIETSKECNSNEQALDNLVEEPSMEPRTSTPNPQDIFGELNEKMEREFICSICTNLFIEAVTLNCSHTFCSFCIRIWRRQKSHCPICRTRISTTTRTLVLDNVLDKMMECLSEEDRKQRKAVVEERKKENSTEISLRFLAVTRTLINNVNSGLTTDSQVDALLDIEGNSNVAEVDNEEDIVDPNEFSHSEEDFEENRDEVNMEGEDEGSVITDYEPDLDMEDNLNVDHPDEWDEVNMEREDEGSLNSYYEQDLFMEDNLNVDHLDDWNDDF